MAKLGSVLCSLLFFILCVTNPSYITATSSIYNVLSFGAKPNGVKDSTQAFLSAWTEACGSTKAAVIKVPKGRYLLQSLTFKGDCKNLDITFRIDGTLVAPADYRVLGRNGNWLSFEGVTGVSIIGGALDAKGSALWACKRAGTKCPSGATVCIYELNVFYT